MARSYKAAFSTLLKAQEELNRQDISLLPVEAQLALLTAQQNVYLELQALQVQKMTARTDQYVALTSGFRQSELGFKKIQNWALEAEQTGKMVTGLLKGITLVLSLL